jgi:hypothetical protein
MGVVHAEAVGPSARLSSAERDAFELLSQRLEAVGFAGVDPYDALASPLLRACARGRLGELAAIQALKRLPVNLRPLLRVPQLRHTKALALLAAAHARVAPFDRSGRAAELALDLVDLLAARAIRSGGGAGYGYDFDVRTRWGAYRRGTPNAVATAFAADAFLECAQLGRADLLERAADCLEFAHGVLLRKHGRERFFAYYPGAAVPVHNASMLLAGVAARFAGSSTTLLGAAADAVAFTLRRQERDGSWPYAGPPGPRFVDGYHTAYVLEALRRWHALTGDPDALAALHRGLDLYLDRLIDPDGAPRATLGSRYPVETHAAATAISTLTRLASTDARAEAAAGRVLAYALANLVRADGRFLFRRGRYLVNRIAYVRWSDAHMLLALAERIAAKEQNG